MVNKAGRKGTAGENGGVELFKEIWPAVERRKTNGAKDRGDLSPGGYPVPSVVVEIKNAATLNFSGWLKEAEDERINAGAEIGVVLAKRRGHTDPKKWYAMMTGETLVFLLKKAGYAYGQEDPTVSGG